MVLRTRSPEEPYLIERGPDYFEYQLPISVKAVLNWRGKLPLLKNERDEWELPGGKLDLGESPDRCLAREIKEELGWESRVGEPRRIRTITRWLGDRRRGGGPTQSKSSPRKPLRALRL